MDKVKVNFGEHPLRKNAKFLLQVINKLSVHKKNNAYTKSKLVASLTD